MPCEKYNTFYSLYYLNQVTPAQIREAEKSLKIMEGMIEAMTPGGFPLKISFFDYLFHLFWVFTTFHNFCQTLSLQAEMQGEIQKMILEKKIT